MQIKFYFYLCCDQQMQCPYNYVFAFLTTKFLIRAKFLRRQQRYLMPLVKKFLITTLYGASNYQTILPKNIVPSY